MNSEQSTETSPSDLGPTGPEGVHAAALVRWLNEAQRRPGDYALAHNGVRLIDPACAATSEMVRRVMRTEVTQAVARTHFSQAAPSAISVLHRVKGVMTAMANECVVYINAFGIDNEDALSELARVCMATVQARHPGTGPAEIARTEMVKIVWGAQNAARVRLKARKSAGKFVPVN